jgi:hypothetical protein
MLACGSADATVEHAAKASTPNQVMIFIFILLSFREMSFTPT